MKLSPTYEPDPGNDRFFVFKMPRRKGPCEPDEARAYLQLYSDVETWCVDNLGRQDSRKIPNWSFVSGTRLRIRDATHATAFRMVWC